MIRLYLQPGFTGEHSTYDLAGQTVTVDLRFEPLEPFRAGSISPSDPAPLALASPPRAATSRTPTYRGPGWLGGRWRQVEAWSGTGPREGATLLRIEEAGEYQLLPTGEIVRHPADSSLPLSNEDAQLVAEIAFGPALLSQLAQRSTFALHASAVRIGDNAIAFAGESGAGKSTLAAQLATLGNWPRIADDVLPIRWPAPKTGNTTGDTTDNRLQALPHFPQLKLPASQQYPRTEATQLPLTHLFLLSPTIAGAPSLQTVSRQEATLALVHHAIASKLFPPHLQAQLLQAAAQATPALEIHQLTYPHTPQAVAQVRELLHTRHGL